MTTLVTGGIGWVPSHIVRRLAESGEQVIVYDLMEPDALFDELLGDHRDTVTVERGDVADLARMGEVAGRHDVDMIVAAAAITPRIDREREEPARIITVNLGGVVNALEVARSLPDLRRFLYISSGAAWGDVEGVRELAEEIPSAATSLYGVTKHTSERVVSRYRTLFGIDAVSVRLANVFGPMERVTPGYRGATELREMLRIWTEGAPVKVTSLEGPHLDWTYVGDIAEGVYRLLMSDSLNHDLYSLTCGRLFSIGDVLSQFERWLPDFRYEVVPEAEANYPVSGEPPGPVPSNARLTVDLGWAPEIPFEEGMRRYLDWIVRHGPQ